MVPVFRPVGWVIVLAGVGLVDGFRPFMDELGLPLDLRDELSEQMVLAFEAEGEQVVGREASQSGLEGFYFLVQVFDVFADRFEGVVHELEHVVYFLGELFCVESVVLESVVLEEVEFGDQAGED